MQASYSVHRRYVHDLTVCIQVNVTPVAQEGSSWVRSACALIASILVCNLLRCCLTYFFASRYLNYNELTSVPSGFFDGLGALNIL